LKTLKVILSLSVLIGLTSCASGSRQYRVTFDSTPQGASLICNGKNWGYTPITLYYDEKVKTQPSLNVSNCSANWSSGARQNYPSNLTIYPQGGTNIALPRPNVAGYAQDANFALQVQSMKAQQKQADAAQRQASTAAWQAIEANRQNNKPITCTTLYGVTTCN